MKDTIKNILALSRFQEFTAFVIVTTLLGVASAQGVFGLRLIAVLIANLLVVAFAFMINDIEDADDDALCPVKSKRNPIAGKRMSKNKGYLVTFAVAAVAYIIFLFLGIVPGIVGLISLLLSFLYSWRWIRLKSIPVLDIISHGFMLAGLQFLAGYAVFESKINLQGVWPFLAIILISFYGQLFNELRDLEVDKKAGIKHTANLIGHRYAQWLMIFFLLSGLVAGFIGIFVVRVVVWWVLVFLGIVAAILFIKSLITFLRKKSIMESQTSFQKPIEIATAVGLLLQFFVPWVFSYIR